MSEQYPTLQELPESLCAAARALDMMRLVDAQHVPHVIYAGNTGIQIGRCPGVVND